MSLLDKEDYGIGKNFQDQKDELLALESIYSDRPQSFEYSVVEEDGKSLIQGFINVHLAELEKPVVVQQTALQAFEVNYLPPVKLRFKFTPKYPSSDPPEFSLFATWLQVDMENHLNSALLDLWNSYCGMPILFTWVQTLEDEITKWFAQNRVISLDKAALKKDSFFDGSLNLVKELKDYQEQAFQDNFEKAWYDCEVCFESRSGSDSIRFSPCGHVFCLDCVSAFYHQMLKDSTIKRLECLNDGCDSFASQMQLRRILTPIEFEKHEKLLLEGALDLMSDVVTCPRLSCQAPVLLETSDANSTQPRSVLPGRCSMCNYTFCVLCKKTYHALEPCSLNTGQRAKLIAQYENASPEEKEIIQMRFGGKVNFLRELEAAKSCAWIEDHSVHCPRCRVAIEKNAGCNKMLCTKCGQAFCYLCGTKLSASNPYAHFNVSGSTCFNRLFEGVEVSDNDDDEDDNDGNWFGLGDVDSSDMDE